MAISLELLAPAGNAEIGIAAIDHGADAVYVGAPQFSARAAAGVDLSGIARLISHAHLYNARVYVALNTILTDKELPQALDVILRIYEMGADGLIIQDFGLLEMDLPPIPLIASTQMHNHSPEKVRFLEEVGFRRAILARELSLEEIAGIRARTGIELEAFVHGALCVSYSGQCYMSQAIAGRSGNRGVCAQPCRSRYTLTDASGKAVVSGKYLLSLKDLNLMNDIPGLISAGISSFKIEGRYKEIDYVKNVTAAYSRLLDAFVADHSDFCRSSSGRSEQSFTPDVAKSFNRGFARYFISGGREKISSMDTRKSIGERVGRVIRLEREYFLTDCLDLRNGDGLCFFSKERKLLGFRIERVEDGRIYPSSRDGLSEGTVLFRNYGIDFVRRLNRNSCRRSIAVEICFSREGDRIRATAVDEDGNKPEVCRIAPYQEARDAEKNRLQIEKHLAGSGNTVFKVVRVSICGDPGFLQAGIINRLRRDLLEELVAIRQANYRRQTAVVIRNSIPYPETKLDFHANVLNGHARKFYARHGAEVLESAFEVLPEAAGREVMRTRYCLRYELDACPKYGHSSRKLEEPLTISDGRHSYRLEFDCQTCHMSVIFLGKK